MDVEPGWYPDRVDPARERYWDGARWSDETRAVEAAPPPPPPPSSSPPPPAPVVLAPAPAPPGRGPGRAVAVGAAALVVLLGVVAGAVVATRSGDDPEPAPPSTSEIALDEDVTTTTEAFDPVTEPAVVCPPDPATPELVRYWQDDAGIHVVVTITSQCEADQVLDDPEAGFGLFVGADPLVTGTFDLSGRPLGVPAGGTSGELELLFATAQVDHELRSRVYLPGSEAAAGTGGFDLRYVFRCEQGAGGATSGDATSDESASLGGADAVTATGAAPTEPPPPDPSADAEALAVLEAIHRSDAPAREALRGQWVPQVSAKRLDADATRDVFTGQTIVHTPRVFLDKLRAWEARYGEATILLRGSDFPSICGSEQSPSCTSLWIVAVAEPRATPEAVFYDWCGPEGLNMIDDVPIADTNQLNCAAYRYSDDTETPDSFVG